MKENKEMSIMSVSKIKKIAITKREMYRSSKNDGKYYLPPFSQADRNFILDVMTRIKRSTNSNNLHRYLN